MSRLLDSPHQITYSPIITVKEARKLLGSETKEMSDTQVQELITILTLLARHTLNNISSKNYQGSDTIQI